MTTRVDHDARRRLLADAVARLANERGIHDVGLRDIAREAGMSLGALQHYFDSKGELLAYALHVAGQDAAARVQGRLAELAAPSPRTVVEQTLAELVPTSPESRAALVVQTAYLSMAVHDERLREIRGEGVGPLRDLLAMMLRRADAAGELAPGRDPDTEAMTLICLAAGVTDYVQLSALTAEQGWLLVRSHLDRLFS